MAGRSTGWKRWVRIRVAAPDGFLLPTVVVLGLAISIAGVLALQSVTQNSRTLGVQSYKSIANQAAKAGIVMAQKCLSDPVISSLTVWPLETTRCLGGGERNVVKTTDVGGEYESVFSVTIATPYSVGGNIGVLLTSTGKVNARGVTASTDVVRAFAQTVDDNRFSRNVQQVSAGPSTACVVAADPDGRNGWPYCWGSNNAGQLGIGYHLGGVYDSSGYTTLPMAVAAGSVPEVQPREQKHFVCNGWQTSWLGCLSFGSYTVTDVYVPGSPAATSSLQGKVVSKVSVGATHVCAIARDSEYDAQSAKAYCWGRNDYGQLGTRSSSTSQPVLVPVAVDTAAFRQETTPGYCNWFGPPNPFGCWGTGVWVNPVTVTYPASALENKTVVDITAGADFTCAKYVERSAVTNGAGGTTAAAANALGGKVACWGKNDNGQLGIGNRDTRTYPVSVDETVAGLLGRQVKSLATLKSGATMCVTDTTDSLYCWGQNYAGQVGDGNHAPSYEQLIWACGWQFGDRYPGINNGADALSPRLIALLKMRNVYIYDNWTTAIATPASLANQNRAYYWGGTTSVGCGVLNAAARYTYWNPPTVSTVADPFGTQALPSLTAGNPHRGPFCALLTGNKLHCMGLSPSPSDPAAPLNETARLGDRTIVGMDVGTSGYACIVTKQMGLNGQVDCWGQNDQGQLGNRGAAPRSLPFPVDTYRTGDTTIPSSALGVPGTTTTNLIYF